MPTRSRLRDRAGKIVPLRLSRQDRLVVDCSTAPIALDRTGLVNCSTVPIKQRSNPVASSAFEPTRLRLKQRSQHRADPHDFAF
nr:hypothetical protein CFP56_63676 [Quercus suber]